MSRHPHSRQTEQRRLQVAELAARHIREGGLPLSRAREKAATQLRVPLKAGNPLLPSEQEIQAALEAQLALFATPQRIPLLEEKRRAALAAMKALASFAPRLTGSVLDGTALAHDPVILHLHPETPEDVPFFLDDLSLPARQRSAQIHLPDGPLAVPSWHLVVDDIDFQLWVLPVRALQQSPRQPASPHAPLQRASASQLLALLS